MMTGVYHLPVLSRIDFGFVRSPGPGLGNLLFPIARSLIGCDRQGGTFVMPTVCQLKFGPYLRREPDKRTYRDVLRGRDWVENRDWIRAYFTPKVAEANYNGQAGVTVTYRGMGSQFKDLEGNAALIRGFLQGRAVHPPQPGADADIAIHVRRGDFAPAGTVGADQSVQVPLDWYRRAYSAARDRLGLRDDPSVLVFSDEDPAALVAELGLPNSRPEPGRNALQSILLMARARALVGSRSTFSLWADYLGEGISFWPSEFDLGRYKRIDERNDVFV